MQFEYMVRECRNEDREGGPNMAVTLETMLNHDPVQADGWELWQVVDGLDGVLLLIYRRDRRSAGGE